MDAASPAAQAAFAKGKEDAWKKKPAANRAGDPLDVRDAYAAGYQAGTEERGAIERFRKEHGRRPRI